MAKYPQTITTLIELLKNLPGVGTKTAERYAFSMLGWDEEIRLSLSKQLEMLSSKIVPCTICGSYTQYDNKGEKVEDQNCSVKNSECQYCNSLTRDGSSLLVVAYPKETFALEELSGFRGKFHVLGGLLSPLEDVHPEDLSFDILKQRIIHENITEIVLALDTTIEGDTTALFIKELLAELPVAISRLAHGMPIGSSLEYVDEHTLHQAFAGRRNF